MRFVTQNISNYWCCWSLTNRISYNFFDSFQQENIVGQRPTIAPIANILN